MNPRPNVIAIYIYCTGDQKERIEAMAKRVNESVSAYCCDAVMERVRADERKYRKTT